MRCAFETIDAFGYVEHLWLERLPPGEGEQLSRELGGAVHRVRDGVDVPDPPLLGQVGATQEVDGGAHDGEQIVEVVCDAARKLPHRLHLLRLAQRFLGTAMLGHVAADAVEHAVTGYACPGDGAVASVGMMQAILEVDKALTPGQSFDCLS
jgi:hypothetical protein